MLTISLFGTMHLTKDGEIVTLAPSGRCLFAYLLFYSTRQHRREVLADLFWRQYDEQKARNCLNTALWRVRKVLEPCRIERGTFITTTDEGAVGFNCDSEHRLDVTIFEDMANLQLTKPVEALNTTDITALEKALALYTADLLEGQYDDWVLRERERLRRLHLNCLAHLMHYHKYRETFQEGIKYGRHILELDPLREEIHRDVMRLYISNGQRTQAIRQYEHCHKTVMDELGIPPMPETQALYAQIIRDTQPRKGKKDHAVHKESLRYALEELHHAEQDLIQAQNRLSSAAKLVEHISNSS